MEVQVAVPGAEDDEDDDYMDGGVYNPWKIPLGWDGKPLPVWLYKLHGLNVEFKCEICGNASYWGRRAFEVHFNEAQHVAGLRALGIRMGKEYYEITSIAEARALHETIKARDRGGFTAAMDEEVEDADGTVYTRKTYEDLKRQGII
jgi:splicing factor 3A subunit 3